jgi:hypothetical protein
MASAPLDPDQSRRLRQLVHDDREAATKALSALPLEAQVGFVCDAPVNRRGALLAVLPEPERVIPALPEAELCFTVKAVGLPDAGWILEHATPEQIVASVDLDAWSGYELDVSTLSDWIDAIATTERASLMRAFLALDTELAVLFLRSKLDLVQKPTGDDGWSPPTGGQTLEGQFYFQAQAEGDDIATIVTVLRALFEDDYWTYFRLMQGVLWELDSDAEEWAQRWRSGRLEDLGFPAWDEAMRIYRFIAPKDRARLEEDESPLEVSPWSLPIWLPQLPDVGQAGHRVFAAFADLTEDERRACFYSFTALANRVAVADRMPLSDSESTPRAIEKTARFVSDGLAHVALQTGLADADVLRRATLERLFAVGANLDPESARP